MDSLGIQTKAVFDIKYDWYNNDWCKIFVLFGFGCHPLGIYELPEFDELKTMIYYIVLILISQGTAALAIASQNLRLNDFIITMKHSFYI